MTRKTLAWDSQVVDNPYHAATDGNLHNSQPLRHSHSGASRAEQLVGELIHDLSTSEDEENDAATPLPRPFERTGSGDSTGSGLKASGLSSEKLGSSSDSWCDKLRRAFPICAIGFVVLAGGYYHTLVARALEAFVDWVQALGLLAPPMLALVVALLQLLMLPTFPLMAGAGVVFPTIFGYVEGQAVGVVAVFAGLWLGSMVTFMLGRRCFKEWAEEELKKFAWMHIVNRMIDEQGWWVVLLARMSPLLPAEVFNYACSLTSLSYTGFGVGCIGSIVPTTMWVCTSASAAAAAASASGDEDPAQERRRQVFSVLFMVFNLGFLLVLTAVLGAAFQTYQEKAKTTIDAHIAVLRQSSGNLAPHKVEKIRRELTRDLAWQRLRRKSRKSSANMTIKRSLTWAAGSAVGRHSTV